MPAISTSLEHIGLRAQRDLSKNKAAKAAATDRPQARRPSDHSSANTAAKANSARPANQHTLPEQRTLAEQSSSNQNQITRQRRRPTNPGTSEGLRSLHSNDALNFLTLAQGRPTPTSELQRGSSSHKTVVDKTKTRTRTSSTSEACKIHWFFIGF